MPKRQTWLTVQMTVCCSEQETKECKVRFLGKITDCKADDPNDALYEGLRRLINAVIDDYSYLLNVIGYISKGAKLFQEQLRPHLSRKCLCLIFL